MSSHGVYKSEARLVTSRMVGLFREEPRTRHEFLSAINSTLRPETFPSVVHPIGRTTERTDHAGASAYPDQGFGCAKTLGSFAWHGRRRWRLSHHYAAVQPSPLSMRPFHCGDDSEADDIIQEPHVNAISNLAGCRGESGPGHVAHTHHTW